MRARRARLARFVRALLACCAVFLVFAPSSSWSGRDASVYVAEPPALLVAARSRVSAPAAASEHATRQRAPLRQAPISTQLPAPATPAAGALVNRLTPRSDERYRYLDLLLLLC
ncbi:MAG TPA: hypothetical protein VG963_08645 [Polyangiaceae bacterium]|nr:hypothetical protein [Polyangiaceae bacterium]